MKQGASRGNVDAGTLRDSLFRGEHQYTRCLGGTTATSSLKVYICTGR
jgi:hypothetical protein